MRYFFLLLVCLLAAGPAVAQTSPIAARPDSLPVAQAAPDTVAAIHRLFAAKRHQSAAVISTTVGTGLLCLLIAENTRHTYNLDTGSIIVPIIATGISLLSIPVTAIQIGYYRQFARRKEQRALAAFEEHKLPKRIKRRLRPEYFETSRSK